MDAMNGIDLDQASQEFGLLSDATRLHILAILSKGPKNVSALCEILELKQPTASHHLGLLRRVGLVNSTRDGKSVVYEIDASRVAMLRDMLAALSPETRGAARSNKMLEVSVPAALETLLEEVEAEIEFVNSIGHKAFDAQNYEKAREASERAARLAAFRERLENLRKQWQALAVGAEGRDDEASKVERRNLGRLHHGLRTPESEYYLPILQVLEEMGGSGKVSDMLDCLGEVMKPVLREVDYDPLASQGGTPRWRNAAQWARNSMVKEGLLKADSPRGVWEISEKGLQALQSA